MTNYGGVSGAQLRSFIERIEKLEEEKAEIAEHIREVFGEAKGNGFDVKIMRQVLKMRKMKPEERMEHSELLDIYLLALGMIAASAASSEDLTEDLSTAA
ncbi:DUF2312 domain-containing protein [Candidatus Bealeia paramacronuclearis]|uniref:DUF2312 domain-containing protein n=1 Tax=Candidatus Bealeia paramacronuclearis TaxID=1921001 RepID=A0ABZ2C2R5_9PROT|nr:hypothetical protein [Candidatus Bealeia paramacronuclearis]